MDNASCSYTPIPHEKKKQICFSRRIWRPRSPRSKATWTRSAFERTPPIPPSHPRFHPRPPRRRRPPSRPKEGRRRRGCWESRRCFRRSSESPFLAIRMLTSSSTFPNKYPCRFSPVFPPISYLEPKHCTISNVIYAMHS